MTSSQAESARDVAPDQDELRPTPVVLAAVLLVLGSGLNICGRISPMGTFDGSLLWLLLLPASLLVAWGLWSLHRWAWWAMVALILIAVGQNLWRLLLLPERTDLVYPLLRLLALGAWGCYWARASTRAAFARRPE